LSTLVLQDKIFLATSYDILRRIPPAMTSLIGTFVQPAQTHLRGPRQDASASPGTITNQPDAECLHASAQNLQRQALARIAGPCDSAQTTPPAGGQPSSNFDQLLGLARGPDSEAAAGKVVEDIRRRLIVMFEGPQMRLCRGPRRCEF